MHRVTRLFLASVLLSSTVACKTTVQAPTEAPALGSDAKIVVKKNKTGTFTVNVDLMNLAPAPRLDADATAFVVWLVADDQPAVRAGALEATSPNPAFTVLITLEKDQSPASPSGKGILRAAVKARG